MKDFVFYSPTKVYFGRGWEAKVGELIRDAGYKKAMLVYGGGSIKKTGLYDTVVGSLTAAGIGYAELGGVEPNPKLSLANKGVEICRREGCDIMLAVGGGSAIDTAKGIALAAPTGNDIWDYWSKTIKPGKALPTVVILTIAAAGSETSDSAVLTNDETGLKRGLGCEQNRPLFSILNPELTYSVSPYQTACGIVDIMMHTLERYMSKPGEFEITDRIAEAVLKTVIHNGRLAIENPHDFEARANLMWAGSVAHNDITGCGRDISFFTHQMGHEISTLYGAAHGASLSIVFPAVMKYYYKMALPRFCQFAVRVWGCEMDYENPEKTALAGIDAVENYFRSIGAPVRLADIGAGDEGIDEMAAKCSNYGTRKISSFTDCGKAEIMEIYKLALK